MRPYYLLKDISLLIRVLVMTCVSTIILWIFSTLFKNSSVYDPYWSVLPMVITPFVFTYGKEVHPTAYIMVALIELWGLRLTLNWAIRFKGLKHEDWRYTKYREKYPKMFPLINLFGIHMMPTIIVYLLMLAPIEYFDTVNNGLMTDQFNVSTIIAILISLFAIIIECIADAQSSYYRKKYPNKILDKGLWKVSRHPNYFGEIVFWFGLYLILISINSTMWILFLGPLVNLLLSIVTSKPIRGFICSLSQKYRSL